MYQLPLCELRHVLCLAAHADDIEIGCGGTLMMLARDNPQIKIDWVLLSATEQRKAEAQHCFEEWLPGNSGNLHIADFPDSYFPWHGQEIKRYLHQLADQQSPDLIFTTRRQDRHQDHRLLGELTWNAFRNHLIWEYEIPKYDGDLGQPNVYMPLTSEIALRKTDLLMSHYASQRSKSWYRAETFAGLMQIRAIECNSPSGYAEGFYSSKLVLRSAP